MSKSYILKIVLETIVYIDWLIGQEAEVLDVQAVNVLEHCVGDYEVDNTWGYRLKKWRHLAVFDNEVSLVFLATVSYHQCCWIGPVSQELKNYMCACVFIIYTVVCLLSHQRLPQKSSVSQYSSRSKRE